MKKWRMQYEGGRKQGEKNNLGMKIAADLRIYMKK